MMQQEPKKVYYILGRRVSQARLVLIVILVMLICALITFISSWPLEFRTWSDFMASDTARAVEHITETHSAQQFHMQLTAQTGATETYGAQEFWLQLTAQQATAGAINSPADIDNDGNVEIMTGDACPLGWENYCAGTRVPTPTPK